MSDAASKSARLKHRYNLKYKGSISNQGHCVSYHQLILDLQERRYERFLLLECMMQVVVVAFVIVFVWVIDAEGSVLATEDALTQLFVQSNIVSGGFSDEGEVKRLAQVRSVADVQGYLLNVIGGAVLDPPVQAQTNWSTVQNSQSLLVGVRFRALDVESDVDCGWSGPDLVAVGQLDASQFAVVKKCWPAFRESLMRTAPRANPCSGQFMTAEQSGMLPLRSSGVEYPGSGYVRDVMLSNAGETAEQTAWRLSSALREIAVGFHFENGTFSQSTMVQEGAEGGPRTAALVVSLVFASVSVNTLATVDILFEFLPSGLVRGQAFIQVKVVLPDTSALTRRWVAGLLITAVSLRLLLVPVHLLYFVPKLRRDTEWRVGVWARELITTTLTVIFVYYVALETFTSSNTWANFLAGPPEGVWRAAQSLCRNDRLSNSLTYALAIVPIITLMLPYLKLFRVLRFVSVFATVAAPDLIVLFVVILVALGAATIFVSVLFGSSIVTYSTLGGCMNAIALQLVGYFSVANLGSAVDISTGVVAYYLVVVCLAFQLLLINMYVAILVKAFCIVVGAQSRMAAAAHAADAQHERKGDLAAHSKLRHLLGGISVPGETVAYLRRNKPLCRQCCGSWHDFTEMLLSVLCCSNRNRKDWMPDSVIIARLYEWKARRANATRNFLSFENLRAAMIGERSSERTVNNYQVDYLMSFVATLRVKTEEAEVIQKEVDEANRANTTTISVVREKMAERQQAAQRSDASKTDASPVLEEMQNVMDAFLELKRKHIMATLKLEKEFSHIEADQTKVHAAVQHLRALVQDIGAIPH
jgi:hypothetical protein